MSRTVWVFSRGELGEGGTVYSVHSTRERAVSEAESWMAEPWDIAEDAVHTVVWEEGCDLLTVECFRIDEVEASEDTDEYPCAGGCGTMLEPPFAPGDTCGVCAAVAQMMGGRDIATIKLLRSELSAARWTIRKALALLDCGNVEHARRTLAHAVGLGSGPVYGGEE